MRLPGHSHSVAFVIALALLWFRLPCFAVCLHIFSVVQVVWAVSRVLEKAALKVAVSAGLLLHPVLETNLSEVRGLQQQQSGARLRRRGPERGLCITWRCSWRLVALSGSLIEVAPCDAYRSRS